jgi:hypothetical protein
VEARDRLPHVLRARLLRALRRLCPLDDCYRVPSERVLDVRRKVPTPYMEKLRFEAEREAADPDGRVLSDSQRQKSRDRQLTVTGAEPWAPT